MRWVSLWWISENTIPLWYNHIATGKDSRVYTDGKRVIKLYPRWNIDLATLETYHKIQWIISVKLAKLSIEVSEKTLEVLNISKGIIESNEEYHIVKIPFIPWKTLESLMIKPRSDSSFEEIITRDNHNMKVRRIIHEIRNALNNLWISYPETFSAWKWVCPSNIKITDEKLVITDLWNDIKDFVDYNRFLAYN